MHGFDICGEAVNGEEGVRKAKQLKPSLVILDLSMPQMNGLQVAHELRESMPKLPIVMYTSYTNSALAKQATSAGVNTVIDKGSPMEALLAQLDEVLKRAAA
jgi:DNA-binding NarL/FixJ family response regulator